MDYKYDVFVTYRGGQDASEANALYDILVHHDLIPAIDSRDFLPTETFLDEMARCVKESRYTIALVSSRYATSHFTQEEAIMQKILDNREKMRRFIVSYIEDVEAPLWMQSLVGIRLYLDKNSNDHSELKKLILLLKLQGENKNPEVIDTIKKGINLKWKKMPEKLLKYGLYGTAAYGVISMLSPDDLKIETVTNDIAKTTISDEYSDTSDPELHMSSDETSGLVRSTAKVLKNLIDDLW